MTIKAKKCRGLIPSLLAVVVSAALTVNADAQTNVPLVSCGAGSASVSKTSAMLEGVLETGLTAKAWFCWSTRSAGDWEHTVPMDTVTEGVAFSNLVTGLSLNTTYFYRCLAANSYGANWSDPAETFEGKPAFGAYYGMPITFTNYVYLSSTNVIDRSALTNFPVLVRLTPTNTRGYRGFLDSTNGWDLRFWAGEPFAGTELNYEIEIFNSAGDSTIWVQVPVFTNNGSVWATWGDKTYNKKETYTESGAVWSEGYAGVWHMGEPHAMDSTWNANHGSGSGNTDAAGIVGRAQDFADDGDQVTVGNIYKHAKHIAFWANIQKTVTSISPARDLLQYGPDPTQDLIGLGSITGFATNETLTILGKENATANYARSYIKDPVMAGWRYIVIDWSGGVCQIYMDGVARTTYNGTEGQTWSQDIDNLVFGNAYYADFDGLLDEARISTVPRSADWIWACWMNQGDQHAAFATYGDVIVQPVANLAPTEITATSATLNGYLVASGTNYDVYVTCTGSFTNTPEVVNEFYVGSWSNVSTNVSYELGSLFPPGWRVGYAFGVSNVTMTNIAFASQAWHFIVPGTSSPTHTITASAGMNGAIAPSGAVIVSNGTDQAFTITPSNHYATAFINTWGVDVLLDNPAGSTFTFRNITSSWALEARFARVKTSAKNVPTEWLAALVPILTNDYETAVSDDPDGDGFRNWEEYWSGTDPMDSESYLSLDTISILGTNVVLQWRHAKVDADVLPISIQHNTNLTSGAWQVIGQYAPVIGTNTWTNVPASRAFFRLCVTNTP
jgi:hypothetical protein